MSTALSPAVPAPKALRCPKCAAAMTTYERSGILVDQCRECRGIFLDRGELERLVDIESGTGWTGPRMTVPPPVDPRRLSRQSAGQPADDPRPPDARLAAGARNDRQAADALPGRDGRTAAYSPDWHAWDDDDRADRDDVVDRRRGDRSDESRAGSHKPRSILAS